MKFQLTQGWPVGSWLIPADTVIDGNDLKWNGSIPLPLPLPMDARPLDAEAVAALRTWYPNHLHLLLPLKPQETNA
jgi:hypothetical protein